MINVYGHRNIHGTNIANAELCFANALFDQKETTISSGTTTEYTSYCLPGDVSGKSYIFQIVTVVSGNVTTVTQTAKYDTWASRAPQTGYGPVSQIS